MTIALSIALAIAAGLAIYFWRRSMTLQESLTSATKFLTDARNELQEKVAAIPGLVAAALDKALADYAAAHPESVPNLDGVTRESLVAALQSITDDARSISNNAAVIETHVADATPTGS